MDFINRYLWLIWLVPIFTFGGIILSMSELDMARDWLSREGHHVLVWWFIVTLAGLAAFPLMFRLLPGLADRGYGLSRLGGMMLTGFVFWFLASLGLLQNSPAAITTAWIIVAGFSLFAWLNWPNRPTVQSLREWFASEWPLILVTEVLFAVALFAWAYLRAHNPELNSTEKPMEMAFINGVRNSSSFPPKDPWLADYAISYYYFGYVMVASLADLSQVKTTLAFNLAGALTLSLAATGALSVGYNLVRSRDFLGRWQVGSRFAGIGTGLLAATFLVLTGHLGSALVDLPYRGYAADIPIADTLVSDEYFAFWDVTNFNADGYWVTEYNENGERVGFRLLDSDEVVASVPAGYVAAPDRDFDGIEDWNDEAPERSEFGFNWWQQSRIVRDEYLDGSEHDTPPIAEFPQFSFLLADNHPHVLGLPYTLLMLGLALGLILRPNALRPWEVIFYGIFVGGMIFLNAWDAVYLILMVGAEALRRLLHNGTGILSGFGELADIITLQSRQENNILLYGPVYLVTLLAMSITGFGSLGWFPLGNFIFQGFFAVFVAMLLTVIVNWLAADTDWSAIARFGIWLGLLFFGLYYPWIDSFTSQANGIYPNIIYPTRAQQYFLQFGIFVLLLLPFIYMQVRAAGRRINWTNVWMILLLGVMLVLAVPMLSTAAIEIGCPVDEVTSEGPPKSLCIARSALFGGVDNGRLGNVMEVLERRMWSIPTQVFMLVLLGIVTMRLFSREGGRNQEDRSIFNYSPTVGAALLFIAAAIVASIVPDVIYLRDNFDDRMNTVFKLYYQSWTMFSVATAFAVYVVLNGLPRLHDDAALNPTRNSTTVQVMRGWYSIGLVILLLAGLMYPYFGLVQHYLYDPGRMRSRVCEGESCNPETIITLDGSTTLAVGGAGLRSRNGADRSWQIGRDELSVMNCMLNNEPQKNDAVLIEASGGAYSPGLGRFAMYTGIPTLLGWTNHEGQWRGETFGPIVYESGRQSDIHVIYELEADQWESVGLPIVERYGIDYIVVGQAERNIYSDAAGKTVSGIFKFAELYDPVCEAGDTAVYRVSPE